MQIGSFDPSVYDPWDGYEPPELDTPVLETPTQEPSDKEKGNVAGAEAGGFGSDAGKGYQDPWLPTQGLARFGYELDDPMESGFGSEASEGVTGLGNALNEQSEDALSLTTGLQNPNGVDSAEESAASDQALNPFRDRDQEVRSHEMAHLAAAGGLARGGMQLDYQIGPDGKPYAVGGSVQIDTSKGATPEETLTKAAQIEAAAMAPANPSAQDLKVAADARRMAMEACREISEKSREAAEPVAEGASPSGEAIRADQISRVYGAAVTQDASEPAFLAVA